MTSATTTDTTTASNTVNIARGKYHIWTVGCQMNQADSQRIQAMLDELGWEESSMEQANLVVLNTCSVRKAPEEKAHNQLALLKHAKARRDDLLVALMGCMIGNQKTIDELRKRYPHIDLFMKVEQADILPRFLEERWTPISGAGCLDIEFLPDSATTDGVALSSWVEDGQERRDSGRIESAQGTIPTAPVGPLSAPTRDEETSRPSITPTFATSVSRAG